MVLWGKRFDDQDLPPELQGKKPEDIAAALKEAQQLKDALKAEQDKSKDFETRLTAQTTEFDTVRSKLADIEKKVTPEPVIDEPLEPASPWVDPQGFVREQTRGIAGVALQSGMMTAKMYFMQQLSPRDAKIFKKYEKEVEQGIATFAPEARVMPQSWFNMFMFVKGNHEQDIHKAESEKTDFFAETSSRTGGHDEPVPQDRLTPDEEETCRVMHWDPKGYLERKKAGLLAATERGSKLTYGIPKR